MSHQSANLTLPAVMQEIEDVLDEYPEHPYQSAFSLPELRQKLIDHIFKVPNRYEIEGEKELSSNPKVRHYSLLTERLWTEMVVRGSILHILRENAYWLSLHLPAQIQEAP